MANIERFLREKFKAIAQQIGLRPKSFSTKEEAIIAAAEEFLEGNKSSGTVLNLPPPEEKEPNKPFLEH